MLHVRCSGGLSRGDKDSQVRRQHKHSIVTQGSSGTTQIPEGTHLIKTADLFFFFSRTNAIFLVYDSVVDKIDECTFEDEKVQPVSLWRVYD